MDEVDPRVATKVREPGGSPGEPLRRRDPCHPNQRELTLYSTVTSEGVKQHLGNAEVGPTGLCLHYRHELPSARIPSL